MVLDKNFQVDWGRLFASKGSPGRWVAFKHEIRRHQGQHVLLRVKRKAGKSWET